MMCKSLALRTMLLFIFFCAMTTVVKGSTRYWFFFADKGPASLQKQAMAEQQSRLSEQVLARRVKMPGGGQLDGTDLPVVATYITELEKLGVRTLHTSKWLNAVSATASPDQISRARELPFIERIQPVAKFKRQMPVEAIFSAKENLSVSTGTIDYGNAARQNEQIQVPSLHQLGYSGQGVRIAVFDTGFRLNHEAFDSLRVIGQYDFINNDGNTDLEFGDPTSQINHGTYILSIIGGYMPGKLVGPAFKAEYLLAKTEDTSQEIEAEEDHWIAAAEWADTMGADIITTSLGYNDWYTYADMDGATAPITLAADLAVQKGMAVFVSAGNEFDDKWKHITAPADGKWVIAVGAVDANGRIASFSSRGPTADGRIKPDVCAMGVSVASAAVPSSEVIGTQYTRISGTSASCPLAAGAAALLLSAYPDLNPLEMRQSLWATSTMAQEPDTVFGYGLVQIFAAFDYWQNPSVPSDESLISAIYGNPHRLDGSSLYLVLALKESGPVKVRLFNILGQEMGVLWDGVVAREGYRQVALQNWRELTRPVASGPYLLQVEAEGKREQRMITLLR